jgi:hypothetical protein
MTTIMYNDMPIGIRAGHSKLFEKQKSHFLRVPAESGFLRCNFYSNYSTVTDFAKFRGLSTSVPRANAV